jgi:tRNA 2-thiouridine synthesizing protein A
MTPEDIKIDARGHHCPVPTLRLRRALEAAAIGDTLLLLADDPMAAIDVPHFIDQVGSELLERVDEPPVLGFRIRKLV